MYLRRLTNFERMEAREKLRNFEGKQGFGSDDYFERSRRDDEYGAYVRIPRLTCF
jgi:hypothetical protein